MYTGSTRCITLYAYDYRHMHRYRSIYTMNSYQQLIADQEAKLAKAEVLVDYLLDKFLPDTSWSFAWNTRVHALGVCKYRITEIQLSKQWTLATQWEEVDDTIRHEIAHAIAGYRAGHGLAWKQAAILTGAKPETTYSGSVTTRSANIAKYEMVDTTTGRVIKSYFRKPTAKVYAKMKYMYMTGRKEETKGKLVINPVCMIKELDL